MLVDLHAHTKGISHCCKITAEDNIILAKEHGFNGLAIANHYVADYFEPDFYYEWIEKYIDEWNACLELGKKHSIRIFRAVEVTADYDRRVHLLIYGADESFLRNNPRLNERSLPELYRLCKQNGCALVQAHPFRGGATVQDTDCLDGVEINCHPAHRSGRTKEILDAIKNTCLAVTVGCDYHADTYRPDGGVFLPKEIETDQDLAKFVLNSKDFKLQVHDAYTGELDIIEYHR